LDQEIENTEKSPYRSQWSTRRLKNKSAPANEYKKLLTEKKKDQPWDENGRFYPWRPLLPPRIVKNGVAPVK